MEDYARPCIHETLESLITDLRNLGEVAVKRFVYKTYAAR